MRYASVCQIIEGKIQVLQALKPPFFQRHLSYLVVRDIDLLHRWQLPQLLKRDVIFGAVELDQVREVLEMVLIDVDNAAIRNISGDDLFGMLEVQHLEKKQPVDRLLHHRLLTAHANALDLVGVF